jgi:hypothetical protein
MLKHRDRAALCCLSPPRRQPCMAAQSILQHHGAEVGGRAVRPFASERDRLAEEDVRGVRAGNADEVGLRPGRDGKGRTEPGFHGSVADDLIGTVKQLQLASFAGEAALAEDLAGNLGLAVVAGQQTGAGLQLQAAPGRDRGDDRSSGYRARIRHRRPPKSGQEFLCPQRSLMRVLHCRITSIRPLASATPHSLCLSIGLIRKPLRTFRSDALDLEIGDDMAPPRMTRHARSHRGETVRIRR